jgi:hypothetical protein
VPTYILFIGEFRNNKCARALPKSRVLAHLIRNSCCHKRQKNRNSSISIGDGQLRGSGYLFIRVDKSPAVSSLYPNIYYPRGGGAPPVHMFDDRKRTSGRNTLSCVGGIPYWRTPRTGGGAHPAFFSRGPPPSAEHPGDVSGTSRTAPHHDTYSHNART